MNRKELERLLRLIRSKADPDKIRKEILSYICQQTGATAAFLKLDKKIIEHGRNARNGKIQKFQLEFGDQSLGVLGIKNLRSGASAESLCALISLFEYQQSLKELLEMSQSGLRSVASQSSLIAQNNARLFQKLTDNITRLQSLSKGVIRMQEEERSKISRELHDGIGQSLTALKMNLDFVANDLSREISSESRQQLEDARKMAEQSLGEVRELSRLLRPRMLDDLGLLPTLRWFARTFSKRTGIKVALQANGAHPQLDSEIETMLYRVTQEALNNIAKHSGSKTAQVNFTYTSKSIHLKVVDQGVGFEAQKIQKVGKDDFGSGLSGIRDRVSLWGGQFSIQSTPGSGTTLDIKIPGKIHSGKHE